jgi:deoxyribodipyrimidine photo-lyase
VVTDGHASDGLNHFAATDAALATRLAAIDLAAYARTRNHLDGAVSRLSPYLTHGFISVPGVITALRARGPLRMDHKFVFELAWREYFHHAWTRLGEDIFCALRPPPGQGYRAELPDDLVSASTGVRVIDHAVRTLYASGYLHNHARMWLASYAVHLRKVDWLTGADWMYGHLLDGDLPSNHLSWQWVAGTLTGKPYLFNSDNVARYAPALASRGSAIDRSYEALQQIACSDQQTGPESTRPEPLVMPALGGVPAELDQPAPPLQETQLHLAHPWSLQARPGPGCVLLLRDFHQRRPWSARRWRFIRDRIKFLDKQLLVMDSAEVLQRFAGIDVQACAADHPLYDAALGHVTQLEAAPRQFANPARFCPSFSAFWRQAGMER